MFTYLIKVALAACVRFGADMMLDCTHARCVPSLSCVKSLQPCSNLPHGPRPPRLSQVDHGVECNLRATRISASFRARAFWSLLATRRSSVRSSLARQYFRLAGTAAAWALCYAWDPPVPFPSHTRDASGQTQCSSGLCRKPKPPSSFGLRKVGSDDRSTPARWSVHRHSLVEPAWFHAAH